MKKSLKYQCIVVHDNTGWRAEVTRRVTSKLSVVTKMQDGFSTEAAAHDWGDKEVAALLRNTNISELNKRRARKQI